MLFQFRLDTKGKLTICATVGIGALETIIKIYFIIGPIHVLDNRLYKSCLTVLLGNIIHCVKYRHHGP